MPFGETEAHGGQWMLPMGFESLEGPKSPILRGTFFLPPTAVALFPSASIQLAMDIAPQFRLSLPTQVIDQGPFWKALACELQVEHLEGPFAGALLLERFEFLFLDCPSAHACLGLPVVPFYCTLFFWGRVPLLK